MCSYLCTWIPVTRMLGEKHPFHTCTGWQSLKDPVVLPQGLGAGWGRCRLGPTGCPPMRIGQECVGRPPEHSHHTMSTARVTQPLVTGWKVHTHWAGECGFEGCHLHRPVWWQLSNRRTFLSI